VTGGGDVRLDVAEVKYRYALGLDTRDWALYGSIFADEVDVDFSSYDRGEPQRLTRDRWLDRVRPLFTGLDASHHVMTNPVVVAEGDGAELTMYLQAQHLLRGAGGGELFVIGGYYRDRLARTERGWQLEAVQLNVLWTDGNQALMAEAAARGRERLAGG
jgi:hypothetical protein